MEIRKPVPKIRIKGAKATVIRKPKPPANDLPAERTSDGTDQPSS